MLVDSTSPSSSPSQEQTILFQIVAGTYERLLYGFNVLASSTSNSDGAALTYKLEPSFIYPSHLSCIKAVATTDKYLATGATDEHIKLYDLSKKRELGSLILQHEGSITGLSFYADSYLISASEDGSIGIFKRMSSKLGGDWEKLKSLTAHKGGVNSVDVHPSGKIALSVGKDKVK